MLNKRNLVISFAILALAGTAYAVQYDEKGKTDTAVHKENDSDQHAHEEHAEDHNEGGEHSHGDKDEHEHSEGSKDEHGHDHGGEAADDEHDGEEHAEETKISSSAVKNLDIEVLEVGSTKVQDSLSVTGRVTLNQNTTAQVKARFPGVIRSVTKEPGEVVKAGDVLATVESNDSLQVYPVKSPVSGTVITRNANIGEVAGDIPLFTVADINKPWAEFFVFSKDGEKLKAGQKVLIHCLDDDIQAESSISVVLPTAESSSQTIVARAVIDNAEGHWRSGMNIRADVVLMEKDVPVAVKTEAIQRMEGNNVVFVEEGGVYKTHPVEIGSSDATWTEIKGGLSAGQRYVAKNSFVVKADIGKAGAEHEH